MTTVFTDRIRAADLVKALWDERYQMVAVTIQNKTGVATAAGAIGVGSPVNLNGSQWETINVGQESTSDGLVIDNAIIPALAINGITDNKYRVLVRGPALINLDAIPDDPDGATGTYTLADLATRLAALNPPIMVLREPTKQTVQST